MNPYFDTNHLAGALLLVAVMGWGVIEAAHLGNSRREATKVGGAGRRFAAWPFLLAASAVLYLAPRLVPAGAIRPGAVAFGIGLVILVAGLVLRGWSIETLGAYFTAAVAVSADQSVVSAGPYRVLRHPSYTGLLLIMTGIGLASANWAGLAGMTVLPLAGTLWRMHAEERALLTTLGDPYRAFAAQHKRLVPLVW
ncbi:MAG TPA: isoprenylcysteine carboxylmethyltransferase family protein [Streptosporangiaceae bacterium]